MCYYFYRLLNSEGSLLAYAGTDVNKDSKITAAVASNIWSAYEKGGKMAFNNEGLQFMFMDCEVCNARPEITTNNIYGEE